MPEHLFDIIASLNYSGRQYSAAYGMSAANQESLMADVLGVTEIHNPMLAVMQALETLGYDANDPAYKQMSNIPPDTNRLSTEVGVDVLTMKTLLNRQVDQANTLTDWPIYQFMARNFGRKSPNGGIALLIGSLTAMSSRSFVRLAEQEYGMDRACVVDLFGTKPKAKHGDFFRASGLNLPFATGSMNVVHTNRLIHKLVNPASPTDKPIDMVPRLAQEISRVLAPQGQVFMYETTPDHASLRNIQEALNRTVSVGSFVVDQLKNAGIARVRALPGLFEPDASYLFDSSRNFSYYSSQREKISIGFGIYATKSGG